MKKLIFTLVLVIGTTAISMAQRFAYVDTDYILGKMPQYQQAQKLLDQHAEAWQKEIDQKMKEVSQLYNKFQAEKFLLTDDMKRQREDEIVKKDDEAQDLQRQRFGFEGDLFKKRQELVQPIQDLVYDAIQKLSKNRGYDFIFDKASGGSTLLYTNTQYDLSDQVLRELGL
jgi:outer membrane protein